VQDELPGCDQPPEQASCLKRRDVAELGRVTSGKAPVHGQVLEYHLFLLKRFEATLPHVRRLVAEAAVGGRRKVPAPALALSQRFHEPRFHQSLEATAGLGFGPLDQGSGLRRRQAPTPPEVV
jgi:hypothetical protein